jgi:hypothetical protein
MPQSCRPNQDKEECRDIRPIFHGQGLRCRWQGSAARLAVAVKEEVSKAPPGIECPQLRDWLDQKGLKVVKVVKGVEVDLHRGYSFSASVKRHRGIPGLSGLYESLGET